ncbi:MAG: N-6 DNA methylase [Verrucomicrobia bacterium]|nr:N-6 DNA methylase [Verrucomicrobiota bacterium]
MRRTKTPANHPELGLPEVRKLWQTEGLFSDHYLRTRIQQNTWWPTDEQTRPLWQFCGGLLDKRARWLAERGNEQDCRQELIDKVLSQLGFAWSDNLRLPSGSQDLEPDYILYTSAAEKEAVLDKTIQRRYLAGAGLLEAKKFGHPLSQISRHQQRYPHQQIRQYLDEAQVLRWGVLTNGREWRLYSRDAKASEYFALSFDLAVQSLENFKYFLALFSPPAFERDAQGKCRLDQVRENATAAQTELEADLRQRIFGILEILANGFAARPENQIGNSDSDRRRLYEMCLIFLYRLLFILYAEGRGLLPVEPRSRKYYKELSLARLVTPLRNFSEFDSRTRARLYEDILELCRLINGTDEKKNAEYSVPRYNGGLFDPAHYSELEQWRVCDAALADVLRGLLFNPLPQKDQPALPIETVDYADLRVQQLGSIYEGLLEHHFARENGKLKLTTDKAERKATGAYYTPDYIVKYIVEHTVGPRLKEIEEREPVKSARASGRQDNSFAEEVLRLNICDPAMGSGHFLVEATAFLAEQIVNHPTTKFQAEFTRGESQEQTEIAWWRRRVVETCIYGVDLNPLAVELAKLSLWLTTIATDQPLNFLDHHLRCGNSLIGARLDQLGSLPQKKGKRDARQIQFAFGPDFKQAVADTIQQIHAIESEASGNVAAVKAKEQRWQTKILPRLAPYKKVADLWTNTFFDGPLSEEEYLAAAGEILVAAQTSADRLQEAAARYHIKELSKPYFHWELEFPEVFFNEDGSHKEKAGFDAVIGNPPYGAVLDDNTKTLLQKLFTATQYQPDLYVAFMERAHMLTRQHGFESLIVPTTFLTMHYFSTIRRYLLDHCRILALIHFKYAVFADPTVESAIYLCQNEPDPEARRKNTVAGSIARNLPEFLARNFPGQEIIQATFEENSGHDFNLSMGSKEAKIVSRMRTSNTVALASLCGMTVGVKPYQTGKGRPKQTREVVEKRLFDATHRKDGTYRQYLMGRDMERYIIAPLAERWISYGEWLAEPRPEAPFSDPKRIIVRQTGDSIIAAIESEQRLTLNNIHNLRLKPDGVAMEYLLALLNSKLITYFHQQVVPEADRVFAEVKIVDLQQIPVRQINFTTPPADRKQLAAKGRELCERGLAKNDAVDALDFVEKQLKSNHAVVLHDLLAFLAERMMELNKAKHAAAKRFMVDLKDFHGLDARRLTPKTRLDEFWKLESTGLFAHLRKNAKALAAQGIRLKETDEEKIRARFQKAKERLVPLDAQIAFTDRLIDQIVYRLYELTDEETGLVEGR